jgi:hypothetical protein
LTKIGRVLNRGGIMDNNLILIKLENIHAQLSEVIDNNNIDKQDLSFAREQLEEVREVFMEEE